ncbi:MAG TPA: metallophosphoesterase [Steroidobacteraceae bacterium]|nr:metallophosphoesterase [Steroidobacteraceae bacterium]
MRRGLPILLILVAVLDAPLRAAPTFSVPQNGLPDPLVLIAYGDMRFTSGSETEASSPDARRALVARIAAENPAAVFINGDVPWHGVDADYEVYRSETRRWRTQHLRIYPALGNHEFSACQESICLERWWDTFAQLRGRRWYSVAIGDKVVGIALDSDASLLPGSDQRSWFEDQVASLDPKVRVVLIVMHHPPVADVQTSRLTDHNPRPNEQSLAAYLRTAAAGTAARFVVSAGHIHNYERFEQDGVVYLVSGGGGAFPYEVQRTASDLYQNADFPNYHYVRFTLREQSLSGEMIRLGDYAAAHPKTWQTLDRFEINLRP